MNALGLAIVLSVPILFIAWIISEFKAQRRLRLILGVLALVVSTSVAWLATLLLTQVAYNASYGFAAKGLIDEAVIGIEFGNSTVVLTELKRLQNDFHPTYENKAKFVPLVQAAIDRIKATNQMTKTARSAP